MGGEGREEEVSEDKMPPKPTYIFNRVCFSWWGCSLGKQSNKIILCHSISSGWKTLFFNTFWSFSPAANLIIALYFNLLLGRCSLQVLISPGIAQELQPWTLTSLVLFCCGKIWHPASAYVTENNTRHTLVNLYCLHHLMANSLCSSLMAYRVA